MMLRTNRNVLATPLQVFLYSTLPTFTDGWDNEQRDLKCLAHGLCVCGKASPSRDGADTSGTLWQILRKHHWSFLLALSAEMLLGPRLWGTDLSGFPLAFLVGSRAGLHPRICHEPFLFYVYALQRLVQGGGKSHVNCHTSQHFVLVVGSCLSKTGSLQP